MSGATEPLLAALCGRDAEAAALWRQWRDSVDIQHLTWVEMQMLALLNGPRLEEWLAGDAESGILMGIVRRSWTEAQMRLSIAREVTEVLARAGCDSVTLIGAVGGYLRNLNAASIRPILEMRVLILRRDVAIAADALRREGWQSDFDVPTGEDLDWNTSMYFSRNGAGIFLHWRVLSVDADEAVACEREFLSESRVVEAIGTRFRLLSPEHALLEALSDRDRSVDVVPWQADAALILQERIDWDRWTALAAKFQGAAFERIPELRSMGFAIPELCIPDVEAAPALWREPRSFRRAARTCRSWARRVWRFSSTLVRS